MTEKAYRQLGVYIGNICNFNCRHCASDSGIHGSFDLDSIQIKKLIDGIENYKFNEIVFTGGEPTINISIINSCINEIFEYFRKELNVTIVTNAHFAKTAERAFDILSRIKNLNKIGVSYDKYHSPFISIEEIQNVIDACKKLNINVKGQVCIETPFDMEFGDIFSKNNIEVSFYKVALTGRAKNISSSLVLEPINNQIRSSYCPEQNTIMFIPQKGFSFCCSDLVYNRLLQSNDELFFDSISKLKASKINGLLTNKTFLEMFNELKTQKTFYSECEVCNEYISRKILND